MFLEESRRKKKLRKLGKFEDFETLLKFEEPKELEALDAQKNATKLEKGIKGEACFSKNRRIRPNDLSVAHSHAGRKRAHSENESFPVSEDA